MVRLFRLTIVIASCRRAKFCESKACIVQIQQCFPALFLMLAKEFHCICCAYLLKRHILSGVKCINMFITISESEYRGKVIATIYCCTNAKDEVEMTVLHE